MHREQIELVGKKRQYQAPLLTCYGALKDLTQGGSGIKTENAKNCFKGTASATRQRSC